VSLDGGVLLKLLHTAEFLFSFDESLKRTERIASVDPFSKTEIPRIYFLKKTDCTIFVISRDRIVWRAWQNVTLSSEVELDSVKPQIKQNLKFWKCLHAVNDGTLKQDSLFIRMFATQNWRDLCELRGGEVCCRGNTATNNGPERIRCFVLKSKLWLRGLRNAF